MCSAPLLVFSLGLGDVSVSATHVSHLRASHLQPAHKKPAHKKHRTRAHTTRTQAQGAARAVRVMLRFRVACAQSFSFPPLAIERKPRSGLVEVMHA
eukprot:1206311-Pleurochrysis_carterae.AAC.1